MRPYRYAAPQHVQTRSLATIRLLGASRPIRTLANARVRHTGRDEGVSTQPRPNVAGCDGRNFGFIAVFRVSQGTNATLVLDGGRRPQRQTPLLLVRSLGGPHELADLMRILSQKRLLVGKWLRTVRRWDVHEREMPSPFGDADIHDVPIVHGTCKPFCLDWRRDAVCRPHPRQNWNSHGIKCGRSLKETGWRRQKGQTSQATVRCNADAPTWPQPQLSAGHCNEDGSTDRMPHAHCFCGGLNECVQGKGEASCPEGQFLLCWGSRSKSLEMWGNNRPTRFSQGVQKRRKPFRLTARSD